jgi:hypothetical protein
MESSLALPSAMKDTEGEERHAEEHSKDAERRPRDGAASAVVDVSNRRVGRWIGPRHGGHREAGAARAPSRRAHDAVSGRA